MFPATVSDRTRSKAVSAGTGQPAFGLWADPVVTLALLALWTALAIVFNGEPEIDRAVSAAFFSRTACPEGTTGIVCGSFPLAANPFWSGARQAMHYLPISIALALLAASLRSVFSGPGLSRQQVRFAAVALCALAIGPGLLVNGFLKDHWGRPRPVSTDLFGGDLPFVPAARWSDACQTNCSFVSGEAASVFWLVCLIPLLPPGWRRVGGLVLALAAIFTSTLRLAFGGHYLSDVILGGLSSFIVFSTLAVVAARLTRLFDADSAG